MILPDTLEHLSCFCDGIIAYDDASIDSTFNILKNHPNVWYITRGLRWSKDSKSRLRCETEHRAELLDVAVKYNPEWNMCVDADERFPDDIREWLFSKEADNVNAVRIQLFDAYMTENDHYPFKKGNKLLNFRIFFGVERRDILMLWRNSDKVKYLGLDAREPPLLDLNLRVITKFYCQHYGKAISLQQWEETCDYYVNHFPWETYGKKWAVRKGKGIHYGFPDFGTPLMPWEKSLFEKSICIHLEVK